MKKPVVSVLMITYNQEKFIVQTVKSALMQKTKFAYEIVIGDDASTDNTPKILKELQQKNPGKIRLILHKKNLKPTHNLMSVYKKCRGKYIALLEGDDYWTSTQKLQIQFDFLEKNENYAVCFHATRMLNSLGKEVLILPIPKFRRRTSTLADLVENESFMATCSTMFRNKLFKKFPNWFSKLTFIADLPLNILNTEHGDIGYIDKIMSVYRSASSPNAFSAQSSLTINLEALKMFAGIKQHLRYKYTEVINNKMARDYFIIAKAYLAQKKLTQSKKYFLLYLKNKTNNAYIGWLERMYFLMRLKITEIRLP